MRQTSLDAVLERLENLKEDMAELKGSVKILQEDYIRRQGMHRMLLWGVSVLSAITSWVATNLLDKIK